MDSDEVARMRAEVQRQEQQVAQLQHILREERRRSRSLQDSLDEAIHASQAKVGNESTRLTRTNVLKPRI